VVNSYNYIKNPLEASEMVWKRGNRQAAPNGAVMRCSASAFVHFNDPEKVKMQRYSSQFKLVLKFDKLFTLFRFLSSKNIRFQFE